MQAVDDYIPTPERDSDKPFMMPVEDVFSITLVLLLQAVLNVVKSKLVKKLKSLVSMTLLKQLLLVVEMFRKLIRYAEAGDNIGALLRGVAREDVQRGQVLAAQVQSHLTQNLKQTYTFYLKTKVDVNSILHKLSSTIYFRTTDVTGVVNLPEGTEMVMPGDNVEMTVELIAPIAIEDGTRFSIREGGRML